MTVFAPKYLERVAIRTAGRIRLIEVASIDYVKAARNYLQLHHGKQFHVIRDSLTNFEQLIDPQLFVRTHRSVIVNLSRIVEIEPLFHGDYALRLLDGQRVPASRNFVGQLRGRFGPEF